MKLKLIIKTLLVMIISAISFVSVGYIINWLYHTISFETVVIFILILIFLIAFYEIYSALEEAERLKK